MRPRCLGIINPIALIVIYASIIWPSMEGYPYKASKVCFMRRDVTDSRSVCTRPHGLMPSNIDCCSFSSEQNLLYYAIVNTAGDQKWTMLGADNCLPCTAGLNVRTTQAIVGPTKPDPCQTSGKPCPKGKVCKVRTNGNGTKCVCSGCHTEQDRAVRPVCSNDGCTYKNECQLQKRACREGRTDIEVAYSGSCQIGCANVVCRKNRTCMVDQYMRAFCVDCNYRCSNLPMPVCGADGVRYQNSCHLRLATCRQGKAIGVAYKGDCIANASCDNINCGVEEEGVKKVCVVDHSGRPRCVTCICEESYSSKCPGTPHSTIVCGTNNKTYQNYCSLREELCKTKAFIDVKHLGACIGSDPPQDEESVSSPPTVPESCKSDDIDMYYLSLKHFVSILRKEFGLNITSPKYRKLKSRDKVVLMSSLIKALKKKWLKIGK